MDWSTIIHRVDNRQGDPTAAATPPMPAPRGRVIRIQTWTFRRAAAGAVLAAAAFVTGIAATLSGAPPMGGRAEDAKPPATEPAVDMSASDVGAPLTRLLLEKPAVPITLPRDQKPPVTHPDAPVDGSMVIDRLCRLSHDEKAEWWVLSFQAEPGRRAELPRRALPCRLLEEMELAAAAEPSTLFRISGETTVLAYQGYLLLTKVLVLAAPTSAPGTQPAIAVPTRPVSLEATVPRASPSRPGPATAPGPASRPASRPAAGHEPSSGDILKGLLSEDTARPVLLSTAAPPMAPAPSVAPGSDKPLAAGRDATVIDRMVRVLPEEVGHWWLARFEADNTLEEPPMKLLPCHMLEKAQGDEARKRPGAPTLVFRVSGIVTQYKGEQYLLLRKLIIERNMNRF